MSIIGTGALNTVKAAKVTCVTTDAYWKKRNGGKVVVYAGKPLYNLYKAQPANWKGELCPQHRSLSPARTLLPAGCMVSSASQPRVWWCYISETVLMWFIDCSSAGIQLNLPNEPDFLGEWCWLPWRNRAPMLSSRLDMTS